MLTLKPGHCSFSGHPVGDQPCVNVTAGGKKYPVLLVHLNRVVRRAHLLAEEEGNRFAPGTDGAAPSVHQPR